MEGGDSPAYKCGIYSNSKKKDTVSNKGEGEDRYLRLSSVLHAQGMTQVYPHSYTLMQAYTLYTHTCTHSTHIMYRHTCTLQN